jgi:uncharacterized membrane protein YfcA
MLLSATLLLLFSDRVSRLIGIQQPEFGPGPGAQTAGPTRRRPFLASVTQLGIATYIGYFGPGAGILMMAVFSMLGVRDIHALNGLKTLLATICNGMALATFVLARITIWPQALLMIAGASIGGFSGAWLAQKLPQRYVRWFAISVGAAMSAYFFVRTY